jgi:hypothetical protein
MKISDILKLIFAGTRAEPSPPAKLDSTTEAALAQSVGRLSLGEPGWITMQEGRRLFSPMDDLYAFGEMDEVGRNNLTRSASKIMSAWTSCRPRGVFIFHALPDRARRKILMSTPPHVRSAPVHERAKIR